MNEYLKEIVHNLLTFSQEDILAVETTHRNDLNLNLINFRLSDGNIFTAKQGEVLRALNTVIKSINESKQITTEPFLIDINNFYYHYIEDLQYSTQKVVDMVKKTGKSQALPPQHSFDRLIVHNVVQKKNTGVQSLSEGEGFDRHIVISLK